MNGLRISLGIGPEEVFGPELVRRLRALTSYRPGGEADPYAHAADFAPAEADVLLDLYQRARALGPVTLLVGGQRLPYAEELWLPLFWLFLREYSGPIPFSEVTGSA